MDANFLSGEINAAAPASIWQDLDDKLCPKAHFTPADGETKAAGSVQEEPTAPVANAVENTLAHRNEALCNHAAAPNFHRSQEVLNITGRLRPYLEPPGSNVLTPSLSRDTLN